MLEEITYISQIDYYVYRRFSGGNFEPKLTPEDKNAAREICHELSAARIMKETRHPCSNSFESVLADIFDAIKIVSRRLMSSK